MLYEIYLHDSGATEVGLRNLNYFLKKAGFNKTDFARLFVDEGVVSLRKVRSYHFNQDEFVEFLYSFAEDVLQTKDTDELNKLIRKIVDEKDTDS